MRGLRAGDAEKTGGRLDAWVPPGVMWKAADGQTLPPLVTVATHAENLYHPIAEPPDVAINPTRRVNR